MFLNGVLIMKHQNYLSDKFNKMLYVDSNSIKITFRNNNNFIKQINFGPKNFLKTFPPYDNYGTLCCYKL